MFKQTLPFLMAYMVSAMAYGPQHYQNQTLHHARLSGQASFHTCILKGESHLYGQINADKTVFEHATIHGEATLRQCTLNDSDIYGYLKAEDTTFKGPLHIIGNHATLRSCTTGNIIIDSKEPSTLDLDHSTVNGTITFLQSKGLIMSANSHIQGAVIHGITMHKGD